MEKHVYFAPCADYSEKAVREAFDALFCPRGRSILSRRA